ncbi:hypothetical protein AB4Y40_40310 [Paraburkholderia sp. EG287B]|uniref:hypothetical protein n=1 Tax=Paraburkholderia sp. EG287B TaxID=3237010 RepID=UPI0034D31EBE
MLSAIECACIMNHLRVRLHCEEFAYKYFKGKESEIYVATVQKSRPAIANLIQGVSRDLIANFGRVE